MELTYYLANYKVFKGFLENVDVTVSTSWVWLLPFSDNNPNETPKKRN